MAWDDRFSYSDPHGSGGRLGGHLRRRRPLAGPSMPFSPPHSPWEASPQPFEAVHRWSEPSVFERQTERVAASAATTSPQVRHAIVADAESSAASSGPLAPPSGRHAAPVPHGYVKVVAAFDGPAHWDPSQQAVTVGNSQFTVGSNTAVIHRQWVFMDQPARLIDGHVMVARTALNPATPLLPHLGQGFGVAGTAPKDTLRPDIGTGPSPILSRPPTSPPDITARGYVRVRDELTGPAHWNPATQQVTVGDSQFTVNQIGARVHGRYVVMEQPARMIGGHVMIPPTALAAASTAPPLARAVEAKTSELNDAPGRLLAQPNFVHFEFDRFSQRSFERDTGLFFAGEVKSIAIGSAMSLLGPLGPAVGVTSLAWSAHTQGLRKAVADLLQIHNPFSTRDFYQAGDRFMNATQLVLPFVAAGLLTLGGEGFTPRPGPDPVPRTGLIYEPPQGVQYVIVAYTAKVPHLDDPGAQRLYANHALLKYLRADPVALAEFERQSRNCLEYMLNAEGRGDLRNIPGWQWHHPLDIHDELWLVPVWQHKRGTWWFGQIHDADGSGGAAQMRRMRSANPRRGADDGRY